MHDLAWAYAELRASGRGKHVRSFSYYHASLVAEWPQVARFLDGLCCGFGGSFDDFNVVKLDGRSRVSFLRYDCLLYTSPSPRDGLLSRMPSSA